MIRDDFATPVEYDRSLEGLNKEHGVCKIPREFLGHLYCLRCTCLDVPLKYGEGVPLLTVRVTDTPVDLECSRCGKIWSVWRYDVVCDPSLYISQYTNIKIPDTIFGEKVVQPHPSVYVGDTFFFDDNDDGMVFVVRSINDARILVHCMNMRRDEEYSLMVWMRWIAYGVMELVTRKKSYYGYDPGRPPKYNKRNATSSDRCWKIMSAIHKLSIKDCKDNGETVRRHAYLLKIWNKELDETAKSLA